MRKTTVETICDLIDSYCANMDRQKKLNDSLLVRQDKEEWITKLRERASAMQDIAKENGHIIQRIKERCVDFRRSGTAARYMRQDGR